MKKTKKMIAGIILFIISVPPLVCIITEIVTDSIINSTYSIKSFNVNQGNNEVNGKNFKIKEEFTGEKRKELFYNSNEEAIINDIVKVHLLVNNKEVTKADEIWIPNKDKGDRYFSWLSILKVNSRLAIIQRLSSDDAKMDDRQWKIIWIDKKGHIKEEHIFYKSRWKNPLAVRMIGYSYTDLMRMGYYTDILTGIPGIFFPFLYPILTGLVGLLLCKNYFIGLMRKFNFRNGHNSAKKKKFNQAKK